MRLDTSAAPSLNGMEFVNGSMGRRIKFKWAGVGQ